MDTVAWMLVYVPMFFSAALFGYGFYMLRRETAEAPSRLKTSKDVPRRSGYSRP